MIVSVDNYLGTKEFWFGPAESRFNERSPPLPNIGYYISNGLFADDRFIDIVFLWNNPYDTE